MFNPFSDSWTGKAVAPPAKKAPSVDEDYTPAILDAEDITLDIPGGIDEKSSLKDMQRADVQIANDMLRVCYVGLAKAQSVGTICKVVDTTLRAVESRRKILNNPYGHQGSGSKTEEFDPLD